MFKSGEIIGNIIKHYSNGMVDVDYSGTVLTLPENENEMPETESLGSYNKNKKAPFQELLCENQKCTKRKIKLMHSKNTK